MHSTQTEDWPRLHLHEGKLKLKKQTGDAEKVLFSLKARFKQNVLFIFDKLFILLHDSYKHFDTFGNIYLISAT